MGKNAMHTEVQQLLPWLINDTLGERERGRVLKHLRECRECREERDYLQRLQQEVTADNEADLPDYRFSYKKLMARVEAAERRAEVMEPAASGTFRGAWFSMMGAAATLVLGVLFVASTQPPSLTTEHEDFSGLTVPAVDDGGAWHRVALTFQDGVGTPTVRAALIEARSRLVSGPDENGTYVVEIRVPKEMDDAEFIQSIRTIRGIEYAAFDQEQDSGASR